MKIKRFPQFLFSLIMILTLLGCNKQPENPPQSSPTTTSPTVQPSSPETPPTVEPSPSTDSKTNLENVTVRITGPQGLGSGVIIDHDQNTYYILTARHVVGTPPGPIEDKYAVILPDGQEYSLDYDTQILKDEQLDLAVITFESDKKYPVATLNNNLTEQQPVMIFGWKNCLNTPQKEHTLGNIKQVLSSFDQMSKSDQKKYQKPQEDYEQGYKIKYTNPTIQGMSGSGVFNDKGEVVAIHGRPGEYRDNQYDYRQCPPLDTSYSDNWGISIQDFLDSQLVKKIPLKIPETVP